MRSAGAALTTELACSAPSTSIDPIVAHYESWPHRLAHGGPQVTPHAAGRKGVSSAAYAGRLAVVVIRVSYPGGHSVWLTRRFPTVAWGLKKDALPFPTEADAVRTIARLRPAGPVSIEPIP